MTFLLLILLVVVGVALFTGTAGPTIYRRRSAPPVIHETVYEDEIVRRPPVVREEVVEDAPVTQTRRRVVEY